MGMGVRWIRQDREAARSERAARRAHYAWKDAHPEARPYGENLLRPASDAARALVEAAREAGDVTLLPGPKSDLPHYEEDYSKQAESEAGHLWVEVGDVEAKAEAWLRANLPSRAEGDEAADAAHDLVAAYAAETYGVEDPPRAMIALEGPYVLGDDEVAQALYSRVRQGFERAVRERGGSMYRLDDW